MKVHKCYSKVVHELLPDFDIHGMAHITGGGIPGNLKRIIPEGISAEIEIGTWPVLPIFEYMQSKGNVDKPDMYDAFNMGIGYIIVAPANEADKMIEKINKTGESAYKIGIIKTGEKKVDLI